MASWDAARWRAASDAIDGILDLPEADRGAAVAGLRARDAALADDVSRLLGEQAAIEAGRFLDGDARSALPTATSESGLAAPARPLTTLPPGSRFGGYVVHRVLGRGGMGVVYEADELASGRRVALKVLQHRFDDARDRERFARESQLAASIDHEHCVFVFGAAEIDGTPALAMELMQGTLADRLAESGPMAPAAAVDAALQLVSGLRAAQAAGVLHRDVKPSNCFVDGAGVVKIGDFGISRSTRPAEETTRATRGQIAATPAYASPEQLRGAPPDVRADIYSLGATLYELLTDRRPFSGPDLMSLLMSVANDAPRPPHVVAPSVAAGLSQIVLRCLAKRPEDRFPTYDALAAALEPFASWSPTPATLGRRMLAGTMDQVIVAVATAPVSIGLGATLGMASGAMPGLWPAAASTAASTLPAFLYYATAESGWSATPGKALVGLTVVDTAGRPPGIGRTLARTAMFLAPRLCISLLVMTVVLIFAAELRGPLRSWLVAPLAFAPDVVVLTVLFCTIRRRNGFAGLHEIVSGTRVVSRAARAARATLIPVDGRARTRPTAQPAAAGFVPVVAIDGRPGWRLGVDTRLGRDVWIREATPGTPPVLPGRAALARPTRLRWLAGRRTEHEAWDVYEAATGLPLSRALERPVAWAAARVWLADLARELAAQAEADRPPLDPDRVWILESGRAKLLDDPTADARDGGEAKATTFLANVLERVRRADAALWPVGAERLRRELPELSIGDAVRRIEALQRGPAAMTRGWRVAALAGTTATAICLSGMMISGLVAVYAMRDEMPPDIRVALSALEALRRDAAASAGSADGGHRLSSVDREAIEVFLVDAHRTTLNDARLPAALDRFGGSDEDRAIAARLAGRPAVAPATAAAAAGNPRVRAIVDEAVRDRRPLVWFVVEMIVTAFLFVTALVSVIAAAAIRGVFVPLLGFDIVTADGRPASRLRVVWRAVVAWSPLVAVALVTNLTSWVQSPVQLALIFGLAQLMLLAGAGYAIWRPARGLQDRLAGTWLVPR
jgi:eukaryotic-like serine/threonine-protein kinase